MTRAIGMDTGEWATEKWRLLPDLEENGDIGNRGHVTSLYSAGCLRALYFQ